MKYETVAEFVEQLRDVKVTTVWAKASTTWIHADGSEYQKPPETGMAVSWAADDIGFGELTFTFRDDKYVCDSECMSKNFVEAVLIKLARTTVLNERP